MYRVNVRSRDTIVAEMNSSKIFKTKQEAEEFLRHIKENGLTGVDFDYYDLVHVGDVIEQEYDIDGAFIEKTGEQYLVFASFAHGDHANTIHDTLEDALAAIEQYVESAKQFGDDIEIEEVAGENVADFDAIKRHLESSEDVFVRMNDGTWFTITKTEERA